MFIYEVQDYSKEQYLNIILHIYNTLHHRCRNLKKENIQKIILMHIIFFFGSELQGQISRPKIKFNNSF